MLKKHYQRLDLKSDIYRDKTKSPQSYKKQQRTKPTKISTYQNVCCPNCRYLFKAPLEVVSQNRNNQKTPVKQIQTTPKARNSLFLSSSRKDQFTQTDNYQIAKGAPPSAKTSPKRQKSISGIKSNIQFKKIPDGVLKSNKDLNLSLLGPSLTVQNKKDKNKYFHFPNAVTPTQKSKQSSYPHNSAYRQSQHSPSVNNEDQTFAKISLTPRKHQYLYPNSRPRTPMSQNLPLMSSQEQRHKEVDQRQIKQLMNQIYLSSQILDLLNYDMQNLGGPTESEMPSYFKMLLFEIKQKNQQKKKKNQY